MAETLDQFFLIKATSKVTGNVHYVEINDDDEVSLVKRKSDATMFNTPEHAQEAIKKYCDGEMTHDYTVDSIMMSLKEFMTMH